MKKLQTFIEADLANPQVGGIHGIIQRAQEGGLFDGISPASPIPKHWKFYTVRCIVNNIDSDYIKIGGVRNGMLSLARL
jgi:hypothetical protein